jgi:hypothetical protein
LLGVFEFLSRIAMLAAGPPVAIPTLACAFQIALCRLG